MKMKKAIKITSIIFTVLSILAAIGLIAGAIGYTVLMNDPEFIKEMMKSMNEGVSPANQYTEQMVRDSMAIAIVWMKIEGIQMFVSFGLNLTLAILASKKKEYSKYTWITLGVITLICASLVTGILAIIYGATAYKNKDNGPTIQEVKFTETDTTANPSRPNPSDYDAPDHLD